MEYGSGTCGFTGALGLGREDSRQELEMFGV